MRFYAFNQEEHLGEFDRVEQTDENPLGLEPNAKATAESIRDYFNYTVLVTNHKPMSCDEIIEGLRFDRKRLAKAMIEAFRKSRCYLEKSEAERKEIIAFIEDEPFEETPGINI